MSPFFRSKTLSNLCTLPTFHTYNQLPDSHSPSLKARFSRMCQGQAFIFEACGHTQSVYISLCGQTSKADTSCDRLEYAGVKPGVCESCKEMDKVIERLREEIRVKEEELNRAIAARGGGLAIGVASGGLRRGGEEKAVALRGREKGHGSGLGSNGSGGSGGSSRQSSVGKADAVPVEMKKLAHDVVEIASSWWKERESYQISVNSFQVKSLGAISYKDTIAKCNKARDERIKVRFKIAEEALVKGYDN